MNEQTKLETLNTVQQVLRNFMIALAASSNTDLEKLGNLLTSSASNEALDPTAREMLADLASGATFFSANGATKQ